ncbi:hypothetical protein CEXT_374211 [Caerostris extrusa]|uniref:Uncharacterized protein n=1 Tax=Caerostris extrusa TaxID=172846 RepID=A0AAV4Y837_CAEEX|nr:hypothetical protein CEXT_374211 [Caerostris extrusa]
MRYNKDSPRCKCVSLCVFSLQCVIKKHLQTIPFSSLLETTPSSSSFHPSSSCSGEDGEHIMKTLKSGDGAFRMAGRGDL